MPKSPYVSQSLITLFEASGFYVFVYFAFQASTNTGFYIML